MTCKEPSRRLASPSSLATAPAPVWGFPDATLAPALRAGRNVLVVAHGNSLRAMVKMLDDMSDTAIVEFNIPTGVPILYELDDSLAPSQPRRFLGDEEAIKAAAEAVARQAEKR